MRNVIKYLNTFFYVIIFILGISSSLYQLKSYNFLYEKQKENNLDDTLFQAPYYIEEDIISSSKLITTLFYELEYDLQINDLLISKIENGTEYISDLTNKSVMYARTYVYDDKGTIIRVIYKEIPIT